METAGLPLERVVLFSSGVGYFEHAGEVEGDARVELSFREDDVNDLLKSMVVRDYGGGQIGSVGYGSKDPVSKTLKTFSIDLTGKPTLADLLDQIRGHAIEIDAHEEITGTILGVERQRRKVNKDETIEVQLLNLVTEQGLRAVSLESVGRLRLVDEALDAELRQALAVLATARGQEKKTVAVEFLGEGRRPVRLGYIRQMPVWKTTYRLVLTDDRAPYLQGWAIVENTTEQDWESVELSLVSGRPISFVMDLYQPLYAERPKVELELYRSLRPPVHDEDMPGGVVMAAAAPPDREMRLLQKHRAAPGSEVEADAMMYGLAERGEGLSSAAFDAPDDFQPAAVGGEVGELFQYAIRTPVSIGRQRSAMLPIVSADVSGERLSIYNERVQPKHPLCGLRLKNTTGLHLMQGPITVFDGGVYAGDARIEDIPPDAERLVSYALDLDVEVAPELCRQESQIIEATIAGGRLREVCRHRTRQEFRLRNSGQKPKTVLLEHPLRPRWELVEPAEATETTRNLYRFSMEVGPKSASALTVVQEMTQRKRVRILRTSGDELGVYLESKDVSDAVKAALQTIADRNRQATELAGQRLRKEKLVEAITGEQGRIRKNLESLDHASDLYRRYVTKLNQQEDRLDQLLAEIAQSRDEEAELRRQLEDFVMGLELGE